MARKATADSVISKQDDHAGGLSGDALTCPNHGPFSGDTCPTCVAFVGFSEQERVRAMLMEAALVRAAPYVGQMLEIARSNPNVFPKVHDDYMAIRQAIQFAQE